VKRLKHDSATALDKETNLNNDIIYTYLPEDMKEIESVKYKTPQILEHNNDDTRKERSSIINQRFQDVIDDVKVLKIELFGNSDESMDFFKRNRNAYDAKVLQRSMKIAKILELEELLDYYQKQHINLDEFEPTRISKVDTRYIKSENHNAVIRIMSQTDDDK
jgi:hypothetical protein